MGALITLAAADHIVNDHMVAHLDVFASTANLGYNAHILMSRDQRIAGVGIFPFINVHIAAADASRHHFVKAATRVLVLVYLCVFCFESGRMVMTNWANRSSTMQIPMSVVYIFMVIGSLGMFIEELLLLLGVNKPHTDVIEEGGGM